MIARLRLKVVASVMAVLLIVFIIVLLTINIYMNLDSVRQTDAFLHFVARVAAESGAEPPPMAAASQEGTGAPFMPMGPMSDTPQVMRQGGFFIAVVEEDGTVSSLDTTRMYGYSEEDARAVLDEAMVGGREGGSVGKFQFLREDMETGTIIAFCERSTDNHLLSQLLSLSIYVFLGSSVVLLGIAFLIAKWVAGPVQVAFDKQRAFISDASHELKTPLTILSANADMLRTEIGENRWLDSIADQSERMRRLVFDLLALARLDEEATSVREAFDLSEAVESTALGFESLAYEEGKTLTLSIAEGIGYTGDALAIKQLVAILLDNAMKHSAPKAAIQLRLSRDAAGAAELRVMNTGEPIAREEMDRIFQRFYRSDDSRSRETGGAGLGLSIAKAIVDAHHGRISVDPRQAEGVCFVVSL